MNEVDLLHELAPEAERLLERHLTQSKEWFPHELVPWEDVVKHDPREPWSPDHRPMADAVRRALIVNLLTEDNLPYYTTEITRLFGIDHPWGAWARRWTAEEGRHSIVIRDYLVVTGTADPVALERGRMQHAEYGFHHEISGAADGFVYVALQELATRISHRNTGRLVEDKAGYDVMARVAADENMHYLFYKDVVAAAIALDPSAMVLAMERQVRLFEMPGDKDLGTLPCSGGTYTRFALSPDGSQIFPSSTKPGTIVSSRVGNSGNAGFLRSAVTASPVIFPPRICSSIGGRLATMRSTWPPIMSLSASGTPR